MDTDYQPDPDERETWRKAKTMVVVSGFIEGGLLAAVSLMCLWKLFTTL